MILTSGAAAKASMESPPSRMVKPMQNRSHGLSQPSNWRFLIVMRNVLLLYFTEVLLLVWQGVKTKGPDCSSSTGPLLFKFRAALFFAAHTGSCLHLAQLPLDLAAFDQARLNAFSAVAGVVFAVNPAGEFAACARAFARIDAA